MEIKDFEQALGRLEVIVNSLEAGEIPLEESLKLFEEGMGIAKYCGKKLDEAERKVEILVKQAEGEFAEEPFETTSDD
ncbi:MAG: exodeoxyribonuclease VII small subunit [Acidobacteriota bacterium]|nr:MAG: exodeoxyribonuclease VII small subunit [Acidobacteriota bacterium]